MLVESRKRSSDCKGTAYSEYYVHCILYIFIGLRVTLHKYIIFYPPSIQDSLFCIPGQSAINNNNHQTNIITINKQSNKHTNSQTNLLSPESRSDSMFGTSVASMFRAGSKFSSFFGILQSMHR